MYSEYNVSVYKVTFPDDGYSGFIWTTDVRHVQAENEIMIALLFKAKVKNTLLFLHSYLTSPNYTLLHGPNKVL